MVSLVDAALSSQAGRRGCRDGGQLVDRGAHAPPSDQVASGRPQHGERPVDGGRHRAHHRERDAVGQSVDQHHETRKIGIGCAGELGEVLAGVVDLDRARDVRLGQGVVRRPAAGRPDRVGVQPARDHGPDRDGQLAEVRRVDAAVTGDGRETVPLIRRGEIRHEDGDVGQRVDRRVEAQGEQLDPSDGVWAFVEGIVEATMVAWPGWWRGRAAAARPHADLAGWDAQRPVVAFAAAGRGGPPGRAR
jgi:hypothetical protein